MPETAILEQQVTSLFFPERVVEARRLINFVRGRLSAQHNDILYLCGNCGCGKTSTAEHLAKVDFSSFTSGARTPSFSLINCADLSAVDVAEKILKAVEGVKLSARKANAKVVEPKMKLTDLRERLRSGVQSPQRLEKLCVLILDEVEAARPAGITEIRKFCDLALELGTNAVAIIIVSNSKDLFNVNPKRLQSVTFQPYTPSQLVAIARRDVHSSVVDQSALQFAAKSCTVTYNGDVRKMQSLCAIAKDASRKTQQAATAIDVRNGLSDAPNTNVPIIGSLPQQMLFVLCCCYRVHCEQREQRSLATLSVSKIYLAYETTCRKVGMAAASLSEVRGSLANLVDLGLLTAGKSARDEVYAVAVHDSEMRDALSADSNVMGLARTAAALEAQRHNQHTHSS